MECPEHCESCNNYKVCAEEWNDGPDELTEDECLRREQEEEYDNGPEGHVHRPMDNEA